MNSNPLKILVTAALAVCAFACAADEVPPPQPLDSPAALEARYLHNIRQLTFVGPKNGEGYFSPDGKRVCFQGIREPELKNPFYQIYTLDLTTGASLRISPGLGRTTCSYFHPTKPRMIFATSHLDPNAAKLQADETEKLKNAPPRRYEWIFDPKLDIFETDLDGKNAVRLTDAEGYDAECAYSPDGSKIVFCSYRDGDGEIYVMDADGKNQTRLTTEKGYDGGPFFSPNGKEIVWRHFSEDNKTAEIWLMNADGSNKRQVTKLNSVAWAPYFHPSGEWIVFASNHEDPAFELYAVRSDGSKLTRITHSEGFDGLPVFSPDGKKLMWTSNRGGDGSQLFIADVTLPEMPFAIRAVEAQKSPINLESLRGHYEQFASPELQAHLAKEGWAPLFTSMADEFTKAGAESEAWAGGHGVGAVFWPKDSDKKQVETLVVLGLDRVGKTGALNDSDAAACAALVELVREMGAVAQFRGLKPSLGFVAIAVRREKTLELLSSHELDKLLNENFKAARIVLLGALEAPGRDCELVSTGAPLAWGRLTEELAAANPGLKLRLRSTPAADAGESKDLFERVFASANKGLEFPILSIQKVEPSAPDAPVDLIALRERTALALGAIYRLAAGSAEVKYDQATVVATPARKAVYLGTKPNYQGDGTGVVLAGVTPGSPADAAGLKPGDKVVKLGGLDVKDPEGYLKALETLTPGSETQIVVLRDGAEKSLPITPKTK